VICSRSGVRVPGSKIYYPVPNRGNEDWVSAILCNISPIFGLYLHLFISEGLMHVAAWYRGTSGSKFTKFGEKVSMGVTPKRCQISSRSNKVCEISTVENLCCRKSGPKFTKITNDLLRTNAPHRTKFDRARPNNVRQKRYHFFTLQYFGAPGGRPWAKVHHSWPLCTARPPLSICQISFRSCNPSTRSAAKFRQFR